RTYKMKKILLIIIMSIFLVSIASAEIQTLGVFKQNTNVTLIQTCGTCTFNNITSVLYPNSSIALSNISMAKDGTFYSFILNNSFTITKGEYIVNGFGDLGGTNIVWNYNFLITPSGENNNLLGFFIVTYLVLFGIVFVFPKISAFIFLGTTYWHIPMIIFFLGIILWFFENRYQYIRGGYKK
ncbi:hypothetical protein LCGC14_2404000, partial [marine sediment metagenome]